MLRCLGRLKEAVQALCSGLDALTAAEQWALAAMTSCNLSDALFDEGDIETALTVAQNAVAMAERSEHPKPRLLTCCSLATAHHLRGNLRHAVSEFERGEKLETTQDPETETMYGQRGARYCALLLDIGRLSEARTRALSSLAALDKAQIRSFVSRGLDYLTLGRAEHLLARSADLVDAATQQSAEHIDPRERLTASLSDLHQTQMGVYVVLTLLARASLLRDLGDRGDAQRDLAEALDLSTRYGFRLHETDARLLEGHFALDGAPPDIGAAQQSLSSAEQLVSQTGYHLRDADLLILRGRLLAKGGDRATGRSKLEEAIQVARREEDEGCIYQLAVGQATRYLREIGGC
jgi:tetratricopeptide (TPR) repeat protein